jgi:hypothetical protein
MKPLHEHLHWRKGISGHKVVLAFLVCVCLTFSVLETFQVEAAARPGKKDPLAMPSRRTLFPDHEFLTFVPHYFANGRLGARTLGYDHDGSVFHPIGKQARFALPADSPQIAAAAGRILDEAKDQVVYASRKANRVQVFMLQPYLPKTDSSLRVLSARLAGFAPPPIRSTEFLDVAVGDLDNLPDKDGRNHDEVVICYATPTPEDGQLAVKVVVLDYTGGSASQPSIRGRKSSTRIDTTSFWPMNPMPGKIFPADSVVACALGDLDGDGKNEIVVAHLENASKLWLTVFRYSKNRKGIAALREVTRTSTDISSLYPGCWFSGTIDLVAADFNGDGEEELAVANIVWYDSLGGSQVQGSAIFFDRDPNLSYPKLGLQRTGNYLISLPFAEWRPGVGSRIQAAAGLFKYAPTDTPETSFDFGRRQLAMVYPGSSGQQLHLITVNPSADLSTATEQQHLLVELGWNQKVNNRFALAAGNLSGYVPGSKPLWAIGVSGWSEDGWYHLKRAHFAEDGSLVDGGDIYTVWGAPVVDSARFPLVAYDHDGDSVYLGAPAHITMSSMARSDFIVQEPPKHLAYLDGSIVNVSRRPDFHVSLSDSHDVTFASTSTDTADFAFGASLQVSAKSTVSAQRNIGIAKVGGQISAEATAKAGYDFSEHRESYNSEYSERTLSYTGQTNADDYLVSQVQLFDIWRYRAYGVKTKRQDGERTCGFYEIVMPGPTMTARGGGLTFDWYQPLHENGNILSYPVLTANSSKPADLGSFQLPDGQTIKQPLIPPQLLSYDGTSGTVQLEFSQESGAGSNRKYSHALSASLDVGVSGKVSANVLGVGGSSEWSVNASLTADKSWANLATTDNSSSSSTGITLNKPFNGDSTTYYPFAPLVYITEDGTFKVTHTVGELNGVDSWWLDTFGRKPDPALNLPRRFIQDSGGTWKANNRDSRKRMRGFFVCQPSDSPSAPCEELSQQPTEGDVVRLLARVYNYSTAQTVQDLNVRFDAIAYDAANDTEVGPRKVLGRTTIGNLAPRQMKGASFNWSTSGFGPTSGTGLAYYRVYVVLDPRNTIDEVYETEPAGTVDPGQNNEGWCTVGVAAPGAEGEAAAVRAFQPSASTEDEVRAKVDGVMALDTQTGAPAYRMAVATLGETLPVRIHVSSSRDNSSNHRLLVYVQPQGQPDQCEVVAGKLIQGIDAQSGTYVWADWVPKQEGDFELLAVLVETALEQDAVPANARLMIHVVRPQNDSKAPNAS